MMDGSTDESNLEVVIGGGKGDGRVDEGMRWVALSSGRRAYTSLW